MRQNMLMAVVISSLVMASMVVATGCYNKPKEEPKPAESAAPPAEPAAPPAAGGAAN
jgi:hypothetical protein